MNNTNKILQLESTERVAVCEVKNQSTTREWRGLPGGANFSVNINVVILDRNPKFEDNSTSCPRYILNFLEQNCKKYSK